MLRRLSGPFGTQLVHVWCILHLFNKAFTQEMVSRTECGVLGGIICLRGDTSSSVRLLPDNLISGYLRSYSVIPSTVILFLSDVSDLSFIHYLKFLNAWFCLKMCTLSLDQRWVRKRRHSPTWASHGSRPFCGGSWAPPPSTPRCSPPSSWCSWSRCLGKRMRGDQVILRGFKLSEIFVFVPRIWSQALEEFFHYVFTMQSFSWEEFSSLALQFW